jgi:MurNAc alpha-1-phosphate uridylyltransferase
MKAMILAAGRGERMRPLTDTLPKPLLKVGSKSLIEHHIDNLVAAGFNQLVINHAWLGDKIVAALGDGSNYQAQISYSAESQALETAGGIIQALPLLSGANHDVFLVVNGDIFCRFDFTALPKLSDDKLAHLVLVDNPEHNPDGDFALINGLVTDKQDNKLTFSGIGLYRASLFSKLAPGKQPLAPLLRQAMAKGLVSGQHLQGQWADIGTPERLVQINSQFQVTSKQGER